MPNQITYQELDSILKDTIYGVENEQYIPIRQIEVVEKTVLIEKQFYSPEELPNTVSNWQIIILLIVVLLLGLAKAFNVSRYRLGIKSLFNYSVAQEITREEKVFFHQANILLTVAHLLISSLFIYQFKDVFIQYGLQIIGFHLYLVIVAFVCVVYIFKYMFSKLLMFVFNNTTISSEYIYNVSLYNNLWAFLLIPILCLNYFTLLSFMDIMIYVAIPLFSMVFLLRLYRMFFIGFSAGVSYLYIIVYICSLEILPFIVLSRIFIFT